MRSVKLALFTLAAVCSASAAPVVYSFDFTTGAHSAGLSYLSFQYLSPSYLAPSGIGLNESALSDVSVSAPDSLSSVGLSQTSTPTYTYVNVEVTVLEGNDNNQPIAINFELSNGPGGQNVYLDRDGAYSLAVGGLPYVGGGSVAFSVAAVPEPSAFSLISLAGSATWLYLRKRRA